MAFCFVYRPSAPGAAGADIDLIMDTPLFSNSIYTQIQGLGWNSAPQKKPRWFPSLASLPFTCQPHLPLPPCAGIGLREWCLNQSDSLIYYWHTITKCNRQLGFHFIPYQGSCSSPGYSSIRLYRSGCLVLGGMFHFGGSPASLQSRASTRLRFKAVQLAQGRFKCSEMLGCPLSRGDLYMSWTKRCIKLWISNLLPRCLRMCHKGNVSHRL